MALLGLALVRGLHCSFGSKTHFLPQFEACKFSALREAARGKWSPGKCSKCCFLNRSRRTGSRSAQLSPKEQQLQNKEITKQYEIPHLSPPRCLFNFNARGAGLTIIKSCRFGGWALPFAGGRSPEAAAAARFSTRESSAPGSARLGTALSGTARHGTARHCPAQHCPARHCPARHGSARLSPARRGVARGEPLLRGQERCQRRRCLSLCPPL